MAQLIEIVPKTEYSFDGRANSTQVVILKDHVPAVPFAAAALLVRFYAQSGLTGTVSAVVKVYNTSDDRMDPATSFVASTAIATSSAMISTTLVPQLLPAVALTTPISSTVRVTLEWSQGTSAASGAQKITIGVDIVGREGA